MKLNPYYLKIRLKKQLKYWKSELAKEKYSTLEIKRRVTYYEDTLAKEYNK